MKSKKTPKQILQELKDGNSRFVKGKSIQLSKSSIKKLKDFADKKQFPKAIVLCCSDSRAPVEMIFDQDVGDLFVIRVAGNIVAPSLVGSVEFAASAFGTNTVLVMGHTLCGAIGATLDHIEDPQAIESENIHDIVSRIRPHIFAISRLADLSPEEKSKQAAIANVRASVDHLAHSSRIMEGLIEKKKLKISGALLDIKTGEVDFLK
ncbi:MAG: carbonic anhydrase [Rickettsiales bacterium]